MQLTRQNRIGAVVLLVFFGVIMYITMKAYLGMFFLALIIVIAMFPFYEWLVKKIKSKVWSSIITSFVFLLLIVVPLGLFFVYAANEAVQYFSTIEISEEEKLTVVTYVEENFPAFAESLKSVETDATTMVARTVDTISSFLRNFIVPLTTNVVMFFVNLTFFMLILIYLFPDKKNFFGVVMETLKANW